MTSISTLGAIAALVVAIVLILRKVSPAYGMMAGALVGGLIGWRRSSANRVADGVRRAGHR